MEARDYIYGVLLLLSMKLHHSLLLSALVLVLAAHPHHEMIISVIQEVKMVMDPYSTATTLCGMEMVVGVLTCVVPLTILHGSTRGYHKVPLVILRRGCAEMKNLIWKILLLN